MSDEQFKVLDDSLMRVESAIAEIREQLSKQSSEPLGPEKMRERVALNAMQQHNKLDDAIARSVFNSE